MRWLLSSLCPSSPTRSVTAPSPLAQARVRPALSRLLTMDVIAGQTVRLAQEAEAHAEPLRVLTDTVAAAATVDSPAESLRALADAVAAFEAPAEPLQALTDAVAAVEAPVEPLQALTNSVQDALSALLDSAKGYAPLLGHYRSTAVRSLSTLSASLGHYRSTAVRSLSTLGASLGPRAASARTALSSLSQSLPAAFPVSIAPLSLSPFTFLASILSALGLLVRSCASALYPHIHHLPRILYITTTASTLLRTFRYILLRRRGLTGPAHAARLTKLWCLHGALFTLHTFLSSYLSLLNISPLSLALFSISLLLLSLGPRLSLAARAYTTLLTPLYLSAEPELEAHLAKLRAFRAEVDTELQTAATAALQYVSVAGVSGAGRELTRALADALSAEAAEVAARGAGGGEGGAAARAAKAPPEPKMIDGRDRVERRRSKTFFGGNAGERADATKEESSGIVGAGQVSRLAVRPAYEGSRRLREEFRRRSGSGRSEAGGSEFGG